MWRSSIVSRMVSACSQRKPMNSETPSIPSRRATRGSLVALWPAGQFALGSGPDGPGRSTGVRDRRRFVRHRLVSGAQRPRHPVRLLRDGLRGGRQLALHERQRAVVGLRVAVDQHLAPDHGVRGVPDARGLSGLPDAPPDRRLLRRLRGPLRLPRPDPLQDRGHARRARADGAGWAVTLDDGTTTTYEAVFVANGHHWDPRWPEPDFPGEFHGEVTHAHHYKTPAGYEGKNVLVLGIGNSACDIAVETSRVSNRTFMAMRRGAWIIPKYFGSTPLRPAVAGVVRRAACRSRSCGRCSCARSRPPTVTRRTSGCRCPTTSSARLTPRSRPICSAASATAA